MGCGEASEIAISYTKIVGDAANAVLEERPPKSIGESTTDGLVGGSLAGAVAGAIVPTVIGVPIGAVAGSIVGAVLGFGYGVVKNTKYLIGNNEITTENSRLYEAAKFANQTSGQAHAWGLSAKGALFVSQYAILANAEINQRNKEAKTNQEIPQLTFNQACHQLRNRITTFENGYLQHFIENAAKEQFNQRLALTQSEADGSSY